MMNNQMMQMISQLRSNPVQFLAQRKINIPQELSKNPNDIISHLLKTGQVSQDQVNRAYQMMVQFKR